MSLLWASTAWCEPTTEATRMAKRRFAEGVAAADAGNYEAARVAFQQAYALKPHPSVLHNLGQSELKTGHYLEAARHLSTFLRDTTFGTPAEREIAKKALLVAEAKVAKLVVEVDVDGAEITVDAEPAGRSPMGPDPVYVEPGDRVVHVQREGFQSFDQHQAFEPGRTAQLKVSLRAGEAPTPAASVSRVNSGIFAPSGDATPGADSRDLIVGPPPPGLVPPPESGPSARTIVLATSGGLAVISLGMWIGFSLRGHALADDENTLRADLAQKQMTGPANGACGIGGSECNELQDTANRRASANQVAVVTGVATGITTGAFLATLLFWPKSSRSSAASTLVTPVVSAGQTGVAIAGLF
jgi:hypothetical protein